MPTRPGDKIGDDANYFPTEQRVFDCRLSLPWLLWWRRVRLWRCVCLRRRMRSIPRCTTLCRQLSEVLLTRLQCSYLLTSGPFQIHSEPHRPDDHADKASSDVLSNLQSLLISELLRFLVIAFNFSPDHRAVRIHILRLHGSNRLRVSARARRNTDGDRHRTIGFERTVVAPKARRRGYKVGF